MSKLIPVQLDSQGSTESILFALPEEPGARAFGLSDEVAAKAAGTLQEGVRMLRDVARIAIENLKDLDVEAAEATVGLKITGGGKFAIAEVGAEASLSVKFKLK